MVGHLCYPVSAKEKFKNQKDEKRLFSPLATNKFSNIQAYVLSKLFIYICDISSFSFEWRDKWKSIRSNIRKEEEVNTFCMETKNEIRGSVRCFRREALNFRKDYLQILPLLPRRIYCVNFSVIKPAWEIKGPSFLPHSLAFTAVKRIKIHDVVCVGSPMCACFAIIQSLCIRIFSIQVVYLESNQTRKEAFLFSSAVPALILVFPFFSFFIIFLR